MFFFKRRTFLSIVLAAGLIFNSAMPAFADIVDSFNLAPFVPTVLDALMMVATGGYEFFVGKGNGIIYILVWGFLAFSLTYGIAKMYFPKIAGDLLGTSGVGTMMDGKVTAQNIIQNNVMKPVLRAIIAAAVLLQLRPAFMTEWLVNPFLQVGAIYTRAITDTINTGIAAPKMECPPEIVEKEWISKPSCEFLIQPVADISVANNQVIKTGFGFITRGLRGLMTLVPHGGEDFLNLVTGILLVTTFVASNLFMALLIIQAIFNFGMALILYPFNVLAYVAKSSDKWLDIWPAFSGITKALQRLIITMIACAFILCINVSVIRALFQWNSSVFVVAAGGVGTSNIPQIANNAMGFGAHSILWLSAILTFYLMFRIFALTREQLNAYVGGGMDNLYKSTTNDAKTMWAGAKNLGKKIGTAAGWIKKK